MCGSHFVLLFFSFFAFLKNGHPLECFSCSSQLGSSGLNRNCEELSWYDTHKKTQCYFADSVCAKYVVDHNGERWIHRSCQHFDVCSFLQTKYNNDMNLLLECSVCSDKDMCNGSYLSAAYFPLLLISGIAVFIYRLVY
nr:unnamed protein product [Callosobruchus chinensis]